MSASASLIRSPARHRIATSARVLSAYLDRIGTGGLAGTRAVPILLGGARDHRLAVDVHFTALLLELGAAIPARGLFVLESEVADFPSRATAWVAGAEAALLGPREQVTT